MENIRDFWRNNQILTNFVQNKRNLTSLLVLLFIALSLPLGLFLLKQQQTYRSNAAGELIQMVEGPCVQTINNKKVALCNTISLKLFNPFSTTSASIAPSPTSTASSSPSNQSPSPSPTASTAPQTVRVTGNTDVEIQAALRTIQSSGGAVYLPAGTYSINEKIKMYSNTTLFGDGPGQTILQVTEKVVNDGEPLISNDSNRGQQNITVRDMTLKGLGTESGKNRCCPGIRYANLDKGFIINLDVRDFSWNGIYLGYHDGIGVTNVRVSGNTATNNKGAGIALALGSNNVIDNNQSNGNNFSSDPGKQDASINLEIGVEGGIKNNKVISNTTNNNENAGISLKADPSFEVSNNAVCFNTSSGNGDVGIADAGGNGNIYIANRITNNQDRNDGKIVQCDASEINNGVCNNASQNIVEDESSGATNAACNIPSNLALPAAPAKPTSMIESKKSIFSWLPNFEVQALSASMSATPSASVAPSGASYRLAETQEGLAQANWVSYTSSPIVTNFSVSNTPGPKQIWVEFRSPSGQTITDHLNTFDLLAPAPVITGVNCTLDLTNKNLKIQVLGTNLGAQKGTLTANGTTLETASWDNSTVVGLLTTTATQTGQKYSVIIRRADTLQSTAQSCQVNTSTISLGARVFCRAEGQFDVSNVKVTIAPIETPEKTIEETATIDKDGTIQGIKTKLQSGKQYIISAKGPNTLRRNTVVTAQEGTTVANTSDGKPFILPIGDIAPSTPDGQINGLDRAELVRQWRILSSSASGTLSGDFNRDKKVNSIDWACMKYDFNSKDDDPGNTTGSTYTNGVNFSAGQGSLIFTY